MKKICALTICLLTAFVKGFASLPEKRIPFILDSHIYIQGILADSIPVSLIYDTGADHIYIDKDYMRFSSLGKHSFRKGKAHMGGAGNNGPETIDILIGPLSLQTGNIRYKETVTPIINLREILGRHADGMIGNNAFWNKPLIINYTDSHLLQVGSLTPDMLEGYTKLPAKFNGNRIDIECELNIDSIQKLNGTFRLDLGCGSTIILTNATRRKLNLDNKKKTLCRYSNMGIGGDGSDIIFRSDSFKFLDELKDIVISASLNTKGALSDTEYLGIIGNQLLCHYDLIIDAPNHALYARRNANADISYQRSSTLEMNYIDRTDICNGWIVTALYENGAAQQAGFEIGDMILEINGRPVKSITWKEQRNGLEPKGETTFKVQKKDGKVTDYTLKIGEGVI